MRKIIALFVCFLLVSVIAYADQTLNGRQTREWVHGTEQKIIEGRDYQGDATVFTSLVAAGHNAPGNAGFIVLVAPDNAPTPVYHSYYLWVDGTAGSGAGVLMMSSFPNIKKLTSFPYGDWRGPNFNVGAVKVSSQ